ncbi:hypothetical protein GMRT_10172 [Giardia muris]|uniref:Uncharacterized protein n=1 Tax=Giardia muris TaxID=5742 RepID=A0A4Z1T2E2_GIAMU|nr:hypothetical protein GMRT_10172 [Giardia muris]|eukprot:TNJ26759.1 hypothetical protein GMRT_10172 [Giardia muris]
MHTGLVFKGDPMGLISAVFLVVHAGLNASHINLVQETAFSVNALTRQDPLSIAWYKALISLRSSSSIGLTDLVIGMGLTFLGGNSTPRSLSRALQAIVLRLPDKLCVNLFGYRYSCSCGHAPARLCVSSLSTSNITNEQEVETRIASMVSTCRVCGSSKLDDVIYPRIICVSLTQNSSIPKSITVTDECVYHLQYVLFNHSELLSGNNETGIERTRFHIGCLTTQNTVAGIYTATGFDTRTHGIKVLENLLMGKEPSETLCLFYVRQSSSDRKGGSLKPSKNTRMSTSESSRNFSRSDARNASESYSESYDGEHETVFTRSSRRGARHSKQASVVDVANRSQYLEDGRRRSKPKKRAVYRPFCKTTELMGLWIFISIIGALTVVNLIMICVLFAFV